MSKKIKMKTVFVVCTKNTDSILYVYSNEKTALKAATEYYNEYNTKCIVFEELLRD